MRLLALWLSVVALSCSSEVGVSGGGAVPDAAGGMLGIGGTGTATPLPAVLFEGKSQSSERAAPFIGGTLLVTRDDTTVVAADPDRDRVSFVTLRTLQVQSVDLTAGTAPGRLIETSAGRVAMILHGAGSVLSIGVGAAAPLFQRSVCAEPRGLAYDATHDALLVGCRSGLLVRLDASSGLELSRSKYDDDLVDVTVRGKEVVLTRQRSAEQLVLDEAGKIVGRGAPSDDVSVAFRSLLMPNGEVVMAHQWTDRNVTTFYGSFGDRCAPVAAMTALSTTKLPSPFDVTPPPPTQDSRDAPAQTLLRFESLTLPGFVGPIDMSLSGDGSTLGLLAVGNGFARDFRLGSVMLVPLDRARGSVREDAAALLASCQLLRFERPAGEPIALALDSQGRAFVQSREPAALVLDNGVTISLGSEPRADTGLSLFYMNANTGISCASCHPAGLEDGRNWFMRGSNGGLMPRRTQALAGGLRALAPYHWSGEFTSFGDIVSGIMMGRMMAVIAPTMAQADSLLTWLDRLPTPPAPDGLDAEAVARGRARFFDAEVGCSACHGGAQFTDNRQHDFDTGGSFYSPSLLGVSHRAPYFHDGCAPDLMSVLGVCGGPAHDVRLDPADADDMVQYLRSL